ncbi:histidinol-phosphate aminotransferase [Domibacillus aminovorans]|uniref:Histidinol-phosphate aminotransferase n=1 Tax=Domibacillus aminovorans TaxID=29332 RepID=A0A177KVM1_9BACI|nr:histidinol-phosphate transaminase [Domibacillus aminovorans]OAH57372.1 histidinol-phosphate aminotransferase [Domibacillus aminovorans]
MIQSRKALEKIQPYSPGKPIWEVQEELGLDRVIKIASNENPLGPSSKAVEAIMQELVTLNRYPDADAVRLKQSIADKLNVAASQLIITNGADELITLLSETFLENGDEIIVPSPSFSEYDFGAHLMGANVVLAKLELDFEYDINVILDAVTDRTKIVYLCSPNNPTGTYLPKNQFEQLLNKLPDHILVVFDGAYSHYAAADDYTDGIEYIASGYPVIVLQTFSKIYGLAGVRVGFGVARADIIQRILKVKEPFNVNALAQAAATAAINDDEHVRNSQIVNEKGRIQLYEALEKMNVGYSKSMSNFVLVQIGPAAKEFYEKLLAKGIIVRYGAIWGLPEYIRVSVGTLEENAEFIKEMAAILNEERTVV